MKLPYKEIYKYRQGFPAIYKFPVFAHEFNIIMPHIGNGYRILDFGCGKGKFYNEKLIPEGIEVEYVGIDIDPSLKHVSSFPIYESLDEFEDAGYKHRYFDGLVMLNIAEHLTSQELYETTTRLNPYIDGDIFIMTPNPFCFDYLFSDPEHVAFYDHSFLYGLLKHLGFNRIDIWRGKGIHHHRQILYNRTKNEDYLRQNKLQQEVCIALGLDWYGNILVIGDRYNEEDAPT